MSAIFLSTESQSPAAQMIIDCFIEIQQNMDIVSLDKYTDAISTTRPSHKKAKRSRRFSGRIRAASILAFSERFLPEAAR